MRPTRPVSKFAMAGSLAHEPRAVGDQLRVPLHELGQVAYPPSARRTDKINLLFPISALSFTIAEVGVARVHTYEGSPKSLNNKSGIHETNKVLRSITASAIRP